MSLSCSCTEYDWDPDSWCWYDTSDFEKFNGNRRKRCCSCNELIDIGSDCLIFQRSRPPRSDIEERIWGDEVGLAPMIMCESCGEIYLNIVEVGYCLNPYDNMNRCLEEYHELTGFKKEIL